MRGNTWLLDLSSQAKMLIHKNVILESDLTSNNNIIAFRFGIFEVWVLRVGMGNAIQNPRPLMRHMSRIML